MSACTPPITLGFHHTTPPGAFFALVAQVRMDNDCLHIDYRLRAPPDALRMPAPASAQQTDLLWQHTCFEAFVAVEGEVAYREFNFSPSGEWAMYAFSSNRSRLDPQPALHASPGIDAGWVDGEFRLCARLSRLDLPPHALNQALTFGLCAVIEEADGRCSYWAIQHHPDQPDFHARDTFALRLPTTPLQSPVYVEDAP